MTAGAGRLSDDAVGAHGCGVPRVRVRELTAGGTAVELDLDGTRYMLRITRQGKLILTK